MAKRCGNIYAGIGGWTYEQWRGVFYPKNLPHALELTYAATLLTSLEINGTLYRTADPSRLPKFGFRGARRIHVFAERSALQSAYAQRSRRFDQAFS